GGDIALLTPRRFVSLFPISAYLGSAPSRQVADLAAILAAAAAAAGQPLPEHLAAAVREAKVEDAHRAVATALASGEKRAVWLGALALQHPAYADLRALGAALAHITGAAFGTLAAGGNAAGAYLAGAVPHREAGGQSVQKSGLSAPEMLRSALRAYVLFGGVEPWIDALDTESL